ncbi:unnamed protein product [Rotaria sp. Silwood2]|nr:unnamed protein product [Rotaria sp. Silwood2]CAF2914137.1 unnamed protein product [Rotaria sp. Silwood2]CAF3092483.1 unnamed protein product [Rotaria sp. Silwood2]CAF3966392.1 unnamed protein product [Rotaria sp. Silwood2]CAF4167009.1 unnamed protein product [Rotaria sp. Silwood2]
MAALKNLVTAAVQDLVSSKKNSISSNKCVTAVLIGETGSGKSSLINLFYFWCLESTGKNPKFEDAKIHNIIKSENETGGSQAGSQTLKPQQYKFELNFNGENYLFTLLDTPGMGDVKGLKTDDENILSILQFVEQTPSVNAIVLMLNGSNARVSSRTSYILQRLYGLCPKTFQNNLYLIFSNTQMEPNFDINQIRVPIKKDNVIPIDNLLYSPAGFQYAEKTLLQKRKIESNYKENKEILSMLFDQWVKGGSLLPKAYKDLRENRDTLRVKFKFKMKNKN